MASMVTMDNAASTLLHACDYHAEVGVGAGVPVLVAEAILQVRVGDG